MGNDGGRKKMEISRGATNIMLTSHDRATSHSLTKYTYASPFTPFLVED